MQNIHWMAAKQHIDSTPTEEVCGLIGGVWQPYPQRAVAHTLRPIPNIAAHPQTHFYMSPAEQLTAMLDFEQHGWETIGIYHSHPQGEPRPSASDIAQAHYSDAIYLIGIPNGAIRAWRILKPHVVEVEILVID